MANKPPVYKDQQSARNAIRIFGMQDDAFAREQAVAIAREWGLIEVLPQSLRDKVTPLRTNPLATIPHADGTVSWLEIRLDNFITKDPDMLELKKKVRILSPLSEPVLIQGETGTGKEIIAQALHGDRVKEKFVDINCAGMPEHLIESELFGHVKGAFTGADSTKIGLLKAANEGTIFLDEIGDLNYNVQAKFLRALQDRRIRPVGSNNYEPITCRVVAASHHSLEELVKQGKFRDDLLARLNVFELFTKPIRDRLDDIPLIVKAIETVAGKFPVGDIDWSKIDLRHNYRTMQRIVKRWEILGEMPK